MEWFDEFKEKVWFRRLMNRESDKSAMHNIDSTIRIDIVLADRLIAIVSEAETENLSGYKFCNICESETTSDDHEDTCPFSDEYKGG